MFGYLKSIIKPKNSFIKVLSRIRFITDIILVIITIFLLFQLKYVYTKSTLTPAPIISSFEDYSMLFVPFNQNSYIQQFHPGVRTNALYGDKQDILPSIFSPLEFFVLSSKHTLLFILLLIIFFYIRRLIFSLDQNKSFSEQLIVSLNKLSKLIIYFSILFIIISFIYYYNGHAYFSNIIGKDKMAGFIHMPSNVMDTDIAIAAFIFFIGILLKALTKFFRLGFNLQQENDLTV